MRNTALERIIKLNLVIKHTYNFKNNNQIVNRIIGKKSCLWTFVSDKALVIESVSTPCTALHTSPINSPDYLFEIIFDGAPGLIIIVTLCHAISLLVLVGFFCLGLCTSSPYALRTLSSTYKNCML